MPTYAIGDVHGCYRTLEHLVERLDLDQERDELWMVGDLVNRGPGSLDVLRWARRMEDVFGDRFTVVLGNHDLHLIGVERGWARLRRKDTLDEVLAAPDCRQLVAWLSRLPLMHRQGEFVLVHAGVLPHWTLETAERLARQVESRLRKEDRAEELFRRVGQGADVTDPDWSAMAALTRLRALTPLGEFCDFTGPPDETPVGCTPWFKRQDRKTRDLTMVVGHWAAMGLRIEPGLIALDSGCFWGGPLSAIRLDDGVVFQQESCDL
jgi:bis(5'-nucleosyl)-tetraphosphatase (symmetrical)